MQTGDLSRTLDPADGLFVAGRAYVAGAHAIVKSGVRANYDNDFRFVVPCMMLIGHAIELYLKAWLASEGYGEKKLQNRPFGHNLRSLYEEARKMGLPEPPMPVQQSIHDLVESYEIDHREFKFRYLQEGWRFEVPKMDLLFQIFVMLDGVIAAKLNKVVPENLDWSVGPDEDFRLLVS